MYEGVSKLLIKCTNCGKTLGIYDGEPFYVYPICPELLQQQRILCRICYEKAKRRVDMAFEVR